MKITFVAIGWEQLSISLLSAIAKQKGHTTNLVFSPSLFNDRYNLHIPLLSRFFDDRKDVLESIKKQNPDVIVFSPLTGTYQWMLDISRESKKMFTHAKTIFGGVHISAIPDKAIKEDCIDFICVGEGDIAFGKILQMIENNLYGTPIDNVKYKMHNGNIIAGQQAGFIQDLDILPIFDKTIWERYVNLSDIYFTMASRGCPYKCSYCFNSYFSKLPNEKPGKYVRYRSVGHILKELKFAKRRYGLKFVEFEDDVFTFNKKWLKDFLYEYKKEINVPFQCLSHPLYMDDNIAKMLSDAGCVYVQMGIQSMDDKFKREVLRRYETSEDVEKAMCSMKKYGIRVKVDHMFGLPGEPISSQEKAYNFYAEHNPYRIQTFWTNYLPATELVNKAIEKGEISTEDVARLNDGLDLDYYRDSSKINSKYTRKIYKAYETLFKIMRFLPRFIRKKLSIKFFRRIPVPVCSFISFVSDIMTGLIGNNPDHWVYAKFYVFNIYNYILRKLRIKTLPATKIIEDIDIKDYMSDDIDISLEKNEEIILK